METIALIVAAGRGRRAGGGLPKQYRSLGGQPILTHAMRIFANHPRIDEQAVVIHPDDTELYEAASAPFRSHALPWIRGADERQGSVLNGLDALAPHKPRRVLIHDAARPFCSSDIIYRALNALDTHHGAYPALAVSDTLRRGDDLVDRANVFAAQTPQCFQFDAIREAHRAAQGIVATDDVEIALRHGLSVARIEGERMNFKLTTPDDIAYAERLLSKGVDVRTGQGFDVHKFGPNADGSTDHVMLCGVRVPHESGLVGHSDADVGLHAITDALYGALGSGDIGTHFPPSDPQWRGTASHVFLRHAAELVRRKGGRVTHIDVTLVCERPKIGPHAASMRDSIAGIVEIESERISVKATTSEGLGFTGRREGIAALASATVVL